MSTAEAWREAKHDLPEDICQKLVEMSKEVKTEICGFILSDGSIAPVDNVSSSPLTGFEMDKKQMMRIIKGKKAIAATYHSHPSGRRWPSKTDTDNMSFLYKQGCPWRYLIVTAEGVFEFEHTG